MPILVDGFESYSTGTINPGSWNSTHSEYTVNTTESYAGAQSWGDTYENADVWPNAYIYQDITVEGGREIRAEMWFKSSGASGSGDGSGGSQQYVWEDDARLHLYAKDGSGTTLQEWKTMWTGERSNPNVNGWNKHSLEVFLPVGTETLRFQMDGGDGNDTVIDAETGHSGNAGGYYDATLLEYVNPKPPSSLAATNADGDIDLSWVDESNNESIFNVYRATSSGTTTGDYTLIDTVDANDKFGGFEYMTPWTVSNGGQATDRVVEGSNSFYSGANGTGLQAEWTPFAGGEQPDRFVYYFQERETSAGGGVRLVNSNGNYEGGTATDNSEHVIDFAPGYEYTNTRTGEYDAWVRVEWDFNWGTGEVTASFENLITGTSSSATRSLKQGVDIESVELWNFNNPISVGWGDGTLDMWWDGLNFSGVSETYTDTSPLTGENYYRVTAESVFGGESAVSNEANAKILPPSPSNLSIDDSATERELTIGWDNVSNEDGYRVYRAAASGSVVGDYTEVANLSADTISYTDIGLLDGEQYFYRVTSYNSGEESKVSNEVSEVTLLPPPTGLEVLDVRDNEADIQFIDNANNKDGYRAEVAEDGKTLNWTQNGSDITTTVTEGETVSHTVTGLKNGEGYAVRVSAFTEHAESFDVEGSTGPVVLEDFEGADPLAKYTGTNNELSTTTSPALEGSQSLAINSDTGGYEASPYVTMDVTVERGKTYSYLQQNPGSNNAGFIFGHQTADPATISGCVVYLNSGGDLYVWEYDNGTAQGGTDSNVGTPTDAPVRIEVEWQGDDTVVATAVNPTDDSVYGSTTYQVTTFQSTSGGIGWDAAQDTTYVDALTELDGT
ncbi:fibronectin type III domain-containing protein [Halomonas sp.]|uniref:fibronectin type III domain-containing protein n=1 Tax=Halomonas sp. TaxID=1486246 RepID=UPI003569D63B